MDMKNVIRMMKKLWDRWDVRGFMLLSLSLQILLVLLAPLRKRISKNWVLGAILCLYLLADWAANYATGVIASSLGEIKDQKNEQPLAFWSTFLLVHLGGPDSITAFALQDNDFWHRHALAIIFQCISASYIFIRTLERNQLWLPTLLMFFCGFIKYYERTRSLYKASFNNLRYSLRKKPDPGPGYAQMMDVFSRTREAGLPTHVQMIDVPARAPRGVKRGLLNDREVVHYAHQFFLTFKCLVVDLKCSYYERIQSCKFFHGRTAKEAFRIIELELNFMYDILFTKANFVYNRRGLLFRLFSSALVFISFGLFYYEEKRFRPSDVGITYALLAGAIASNVIAFIQFITSHWFTALTAKRHDVNWLIPGPDEAEPLKKPFFRRWSESVSTHSLINYSFHLPEPETEKLMDWFGLRSYFNGIWYVKPEKFNEKLWDQIFEEVKSRSELVQGSGIFKDAIEARGDWGLCLQTGCGHLLPYVYNMDYDQSLLTWHIATHLCLCNKEKGKMEKDVDEHREISRVVSEYMMYLVTMQPAIMYGVTDIGQTRLRDTCEEVLKFAYGPNYYAREDPGVISVIKYALRWCWSKLSLFINSINPLWWCLCLILSIIALLLDPIMAVIISLCVVIVLPLLPPARRELLVRELVSSFPDHENRIMMEIEEFISSLISSVDAEIKPVYIKGDKSKSVLFDGARLAKELERLNDKKWKIMSKVWIEMLTYAAVHCRPHALAEQLSKGGELISFVWLLMAHFGLVDHFEDYGGLVRAKLVVDK